MDIKFNIKGLNVIRGQIKAEDIDVGISCSEGETLNSNECILELFDNPAVQGLLKKFTDEVSFKPVSHEPAQQKTFKPQPKQDDNSVTELDKRLNDVLSQVKQELDSDRKAREMQLRVIEKLMDKVSRLAERNKF